MSGNIYQTASKILNENFRTGETEKEIRFGSYRGNQYRPYFVPGVEPDIFFKLIAEHKLVNPINSTIENYSDGREVSYRKITSNGKIEYQKKIKPSRSIVDIIDYGIRVSSANEVKLEEREFYNSIRGLKKENTRTRERYEKKFDGGITMHLTIVSEAGYRQPSQTNIKYEVEFEINTRDIIQQEIMEKLIITLYTRVYGTIVPLPLNDMRDIIWDFNTNVQSSYVLCNKIIHIRKGNLIFDDTTLNELKAIAEIPRGQEFNKFEVSVKVEEGEDYYMMRERVCKKLLKSISRTEIMFDVIRPIDLTYDRFKSMLSSKVGYSSSLKADGMHAYLIINSKGTHILTSLHLVNTLTKDVTSEKAVIIEGEVITVKGEVITVKGKSMNTYSLFLGYDILVIKGETVMSKSLEERYTSLIDIVNEYKDKIPIAVKKIYLDTKSETIKGLLEKTSNVYYEIEPELGFIKRSIVKLFDSKKYGKYETDGIVFTIKSSYSGNKEPIYKWKPKHQLTIDFGINDRGNLTVKKGSDLTEFRVNINKQMLSFKAPNGISGKQVGEFKYNSNNKNWELIRLRWDKQTPNSILVAQNIWNVLNKHISEDMLMGIDTNMFMLRKYHNMVKKDIILSHVKKDDIILDIGGGRGGDLTKYLTLEPSIVLFVEPNQSNLEELKRRISDLEAINKTTKFLYIHTQAQDTETILTFMKQNKIPKFDVVSLFFSLTFFFNTKKDLQNLIKTICKTMKRRGRIIGTTMDGDAAERILKNGKYRNEFFQLEVTEKKKFSDRVKITLSDETIVGEQSENLVKFNIFIKGLQNKCNVTQNYYTRFNESSLLSSQQSKVNSLYYSFSLCRDDLPMLKPDETELLSDGLYRVGTLGGGDCFVHSLLYLLNEDYRSMNNEERDKFVKDFRSKIRNNIDTVWPKLNLTLYDEYPHLREEYINELSNDWIASEHIIYFSELFKINIIVIGKCGKIIQVNNIITPKDFELKHSLSVMIYNIDNTHYEALYVQQEIPYKTEPVKQYILQRFNLTLRHILLNNRLP